MGNHRWQQFRPRRILLMVCGLAALVVGLYGWRALTRAQSLNVLLITLDTARADRLGCYGYAAALTPALDRLAAEGVLFERACTPAPLTLPAHASLMPMNSATASRSAPTTEKLPTWTGRSSGWWITSGKTGCGSGH
jgi:hypothetical protein